MYYVAWKLARSGKRPRSATGRAAGTPTNTCAASLRDQQLVERASGRRTHRRAADYTAKWRSAIDLFALVVSDNRVYRQNPLCRFAGIAPTIATSKIARGLPSRISFVRWQAPGYKQAAVTGSSADSRVTFRQAPPGRVTHYPVEVLVFILRIFAFTSSRPPLSPVPSITSRFNSRSFRRACPTL